MHALAPDYADRLNVEGLRTLGPARHHPDPYTRRQVRRILRWTLASTRSHRRSWGRPRGWQA